LIVGEGCLVIIEVMWKMILLYLMWCIWRFEDSERMGVELMAFFHNVIIAKAPILD
jgi:hypothetical protein